MVPACLARLGSRSIDWSLGWHYINSPQIFATPGTIWRETSPQLLTQCIVAFSQASLGTG